MNVHLISIEDFKKFKHTHRLASGPDFNGNRKMLNMEIITDKVKYKLIVVGVALKKHTFSTLVEAIDEYNKY